MTSLPPSRRAALRELRDPENGWLLDQAVVVRFDAGASSTGEDIVELHLHGGRAVVAAVETALLGAPGVRRAEAGEFTRRALLNGRIELAEAEALGDLLNAETETQRRLAIDAVEGHASRQLRAWRDRLLAWSAELEAAIEFGEDEEIDIDLGTFHTRIKALVGELQQTLARPSVERLREAISIAFVGPVNTGKSSAFNVMAGRDAAIVSPTAGTTRDRIEAEITRDGVAYRLIDTAGWRDDAQDAVEREGIERSLRAAEASDVVLWFGDAVPAEADARWLSVHARCDLPGREETPAGSIGLSSLAARGFDSLWRAITYIAPRLGRGEHAFNVRQRGALGEAIEALKTIPYDPVLTAAALRDGLRSFERVLGEAGVEELLDQIFSRFCIGK